MSEPSDERGLASCQLLAGLDEGDIAIASACHGSGRFAAPDLGNRLLRMTATEISGIL